MVSVAKNENQGAMNDSLKHMAVPFEQTLLKKVTQLLVHSFFVLEMKVSLRHLKRDAITLPSNYSGGTCIEILSDP